MGKEKKFVLIGNVIFAVLIMVSVIIFMQYGITNPSSKYISKPIASGLFALCGVFNLVLIYKFFQTEKNWKAIILVVGLFFAMAGDIVLPYNFVIGAGLFAIGHVFYFVYFSVIYKFTWVDLIIILAVMAFSFTIIFAYKGFEWNGMKIVVLAYAFIISIMLGKAIGNLIVHRNLPNLITGIGAFLFFFSDMMLLFYVFAGSNLIFDYLCIYTYYPAEFLLALTVLLQAKTYNERR